MMNMVHTHGSSPGSTPNPGGHDKDSRSGGSKGGGGGKGSSSGGGKSGGGKGK